MTPFIGVAIAVFEQLNAMCETMCKPSVQWLLRQDQCQGRVIEISKIMEERHTVKIDNKLNGIFISIFKSSQRRCAVKKGVRINFAKLTGKYLCRRLFFNKVVGLRSANLLKKSPWYRCFSANLENSQEHLFYRTQQDDCFCILCKWCINLFHFLI